MCWMLVGQKMNQQLNQVYKQTGTVILFLISLQKHELLFENLYGN